MTVPTGSTFVMVLLGTLFGEVAVGKRFRGKVWAVEDVHHYHKLQRLLENDPPPLSSATCSRYTCAFPKE